jgi:DNA-binding beta-propeller fold protein YncE
LGEGSGQFFHPSGVAVNSSTGDVYVADRENDRVEEFEPVLNKEGELVNEKYVKGFSVPFPEGVAVDSSKGGPSEGDVYVVGATKAAGKGENPQDLRLYKFSSTGGAVGTTLKFKNPIEGVAVDSSGAVFVYESNGTIAGFNDAESNEPRPSVQAGLKGEATPGLAVDSKDNFYVGATAKEGEAGENKALKGLLRELEEERVAVVAKLEGATGKVLLHELDYEQSTAVAVNDLPGEELDDVYVENVKHVAGEQVTTVAAFSPEAGKGNEAEGEGQLIQRFGAPGLKEGDGIAVDPASGAVYVADGASNSVDVFELEPPGTPTVESVSATFTEGDTTTLNAQVNPAGAKTEYQFEYGAASCAAVPSACTKTPSTEVPGGGSFGDHGAVAVLKGLKPGTYNYRVLAENSFGAVHSAEQTFTILAPLGRLPDGRAWEMVSPPNKAGAEPEAIRKEGGLIQASANGDAITYAADGPMPAEPEPEGNRSPEVTQVLSTRDREPGDETWASQDITTPNETGAGPAPGEVEEYRLFSPNLALALVDPFPAARGRFAEPPLSPLLEGEEQGMQENTIYLRDNAPREVLQPEAPEAKAYNEAHENGQKMKPHNPGYLPLVTKSNEPGPGFGRELAGGHFGILPEGATPDLSHVVFRSENVAKGLWEWSGGENQLVSVLPEGKRPETTVQEAYLGGSLSTFEEPLNVRHAISNNGSRVFWTYDKVHLEVRETGETETPETLQLDTVQGGSGEGRARAVFQTAGANGSKVFFTDEQRLTADSGAEENRPDLYVAELKIVGGHLSIKKLTDLTPLRDEGADVLLLEHKGDGVIGASEEEGSYVYFVADGALAPGATRGHCASGRTGERRPPGTTCNLYVRHYSETTEEWEPTKLIAALSFEDSPDWGNFQPGNLAFMTSRVSPDGRYLAFMSDRSLTGYDNEDMSSKSPGERLDEEVYLYDAQQERLVCASCNPTGARPIGVFDAGLTLDGKGEGLGLVVDRPEIWSEYLGNQTGGGTDHWLAGSIPGWTNVGNDYALYQSRYLSDSGRLFFNSADPLVPLLKPSREETIEGVEQNVGVENVYEYEPNTAGGCHSEGGCVGLISSGESEHESSFLDASNNGNDVFFLTAKNLVPQDVDGNFDVYDAHVCEAVASPCPHAPESSPAACESEACQGSYSPGQTPAASGTAAFSGPGNIVLPKLEVLAEKKVVVPPKPLTRAQKLAKALKACRKDKQKSKRLACEKQARSKYGPIKPKAKKISSKGTGR